MKQTPAAGEIFETTLPAFRMDDKGREIGFIVRLSDHGTEFRAQVQNARLKSGTPISGEWSKYGAYQRWSTFTSADDARTWAYATAKERIAKLK